MRCLHLTRMCKSVTPVKSVALKVSADERHIKSKTRWVDRCALAAATCTGKLPNLSILETACGQAPNSLHITVPESPACNAFESMVLPPTYSQICAASGHASTIARTTSSDVFPDPHFANASCSGVTLKSFRSLIASGWFSIMARIYDGSAS